MASLIFKLLVKAEDDNEKRLEQRWSSAEAVEQSDGSGFAQHRKGMEQAIQASGGKDRALQPLRRKTPKVGRNEPCPCGSGKKYKKCCGARE